MKNHRSPDSAARRTAERSLYEALLSLRNETECRRFLNDLCTPAELEALIDRWSVVPHLDEGLPYRRIHELTGVSVTTIGRVAKFLTAGNGGYRVALGRVNESQDGKRR